MNTIKIQCPHCGKRGQIPGSAEGREIGCKACGERFAAVRAKRRRVETDDTPARSGWARALAIFAAAVILICGGVGAGLWWSKGKKAPTIVDAPKAHERSEPSHLPLLRKADARLQSEISGKQFALAADTGKLVLSEMSRVAVDVPIKAAKFVSLKDVESAADSAGLDRWTKEEMAIAKRAQSAVVEFQRKQLREAVGKLTTFDRVIPTNANIPTNEWRVQQSGHAVLLSRVSLACAEALMHSNYDAEFIYYQRLPVFLRLKEDSGKTDGQSDRVRVARESVVELSEAIPVDAEFGVKCSNLKKQFEALLAEFR